MVRTRIIENILENAQKWEDQLVSKPDKLNEDVGAFLERTPTKGLFAAVREHLCFLRDLFLHKDFPPDIKRIVLFAIFYFLFPLDFVADLANLLVPGFGYLDDIGVALYVLNAILKHSPQVAQLAKQIAAQKYPTVARHFEGKRLNLSEALSRVGLSERDFVDLLGMAAKRFRTKVYQVK